ncbi:filamentous hemagglutinin N-terminal domain-containing protein [Polaromonas sp. YR568]|uniref:beta strand repeat-containing protein n=1 Tax=Polaromonas sp. YR568 TaxID=1855301 RepID=UPI0031383A16
MSLQAWALDPGAIPTGGQITAGQASIQTAGANVTIQQGSTKAAIDWQSFNIGSQATVLFIQPSVGSVVLNRVVGQDASQIMGNLSANGQVFLINPNGMLFGATAQVNVGGLVASTLGLSNDDFMAGNYRLAGSSSATVANQGRLTAADGGYVALLGAQASNEGIVQARLGNVSLAAGSDVTLNLSNGSLLGLTVNQGAIGALAQNRQLIQAEGGKVLMTAKAADALVSAVVNNSGVIEARGVQTRDGVISLLGDTLAGIVTQTGTLSGGTVESSARTVLQAGQINAASVDLSASHALIQTQDAAIRAEGGNIRLDGGQHTFLSGSVNASGSTQHAAGGHITVAGDAITLAAATLDVSGAATGDTAGSIRAGGGAYGLATDIRHASTVAVNGATTLKANGKDGSIVVWSDDTTHYSGRAEAGERGFVEISSKGTLNLGGTTVVGAGGQILYDPTNIVIDATAPASFYLDLADPTPTAGDSHGTGATVLTNGHIVVRSPSDSSGASAAGAVYLYNGSTGAMISALYGSTTNDQVGSSGITALSNGNYVVPSPNWDNGTSTNAGAVTWGNGTTGVSGVVSASNSLVGSTASDQVGSGGITALTNGNYVVRSHNWDNGTAADAGAVTWGSGTAGVSGVISQTNSLVGSATNHQVGIGGVTALTNGNYVAVSTNWDSGSTLNVGAVTWGNGTTGVSGAVSQANSLIGSTTNDQVGLGGITTLNNGNYVVTSYNWDNSTATEAGAVTWGSGTAGVSGVISQANSLVGSGTNHQVGVSGVTALNNGNYVVNSAYWDSSTAINVGAVTWGNGTTGVSGLISASNSLVGTVANDWVGLYGVTALSNGNYVVRSNTWDNGTAADAGAVTWGSGTAGVSGVVSASNSLVGSTASDQVGSGGVTALSNGSYVVSSHSWDSSTAINVGAVTWGNGTTGVSGLVSASNSLVGSTANNQVGLGGVTALTNGNYAVSSYNWDNGTATNVGAVTWGNGTTGVSGLVSASNSLIGSTALDQVGSAGITALTNGNYVVSSNNWDSSTAINVGAVTWGNGTTGVSGVVSASNSLVGSTASDFVGNSGITALSNGNYVVSSQSWDNGTTTNAGAVTWGNGTTGVSGVVSASNSLVGSTANDSVGNSGITALSNGNYVVRSTNWDSSTAINVGAVTWGNGTTGVSGAVSASNSLVGSTANDSVGNSGITALSNGNYVVRSTNWDNGITTNAGAVTWGSGTAGVSDVVSASNSLVGSTASDQVGSGGITALSNGNYIALSPAFNSQRGSAWVVVDPSNAAATINASAGTSALVNPLILASAAGSGASVTLQATNNITVNSAVNIAGKLNLLAGNAMTLNSGGTITSTATGDAIVLSGNTFINNAGSTALTATNGRWLVYSNAPAGNTFGGLASGNHAVWNATHAGNAPATIASGNRYVFAQQPTVTVTATAQSKEYDGTGFGTASYTTTGLINAATYGTVFTQDTLSGALATASGSNPGSYAITQGTLMGPTGYAPLTYAGADAVITAAPTSTTSTSTSSGSSGISASPSSSSPGYASAISSFSGAIQFRQFALSNDLIPGNTWLGTGSSRSASTSGGPDFTQEGNTLGLVFGADSPRANSTDAADKDE